MGGINEKAATGLKKIQAPQYNKDRKGVNRSEHSTLGEIMNSDSFGNMIHRNTQVSLERSMMQKLKKNRKRKAAIAKVLNVTHTACNCKQTPTSCTIKHQQSQNW